MQTAEPKCVFQFFVAAQHAHKIHQHFQHRDKSITAVLLLVLTRQGAQGGVQISKSTFVCFGELITAFAWQRLCGLLNQRQSVAQGGQTAQCIVGSVSSAASV